MNKTEEGMVNAVMVRKPWRQGNTQVHVAEDGNVLVYLHGSHIATRCTDGGVVINVETLRAWPTRVTQSRLWALGVDVKQRDNKVYLDGEVVAEV